MTQTAEYAQIAEYALMGRGCVPIAGHYVIGRNVRNKAICLYWNGRNNSVVTADVLRAIFQEVDGLGLYRPIHVYGSTCQIGETATFRFHQITSEILASLNEEEVAR